MILRSWRMIKRRYASDAFTGEGSRRHGGRWNSPGTPLVYTAENGSLAVLEILVHLEAIALLQNFVLFSAEFEEALVEPLEEADLPDDWRAYPAPPSLTAFGDEWLAEARSAVLSVPSAIFPFERLYLINPSHSDFPQIELDQRPFPIDPRLLKD